ncbi:MAG: hypothetical protein H6Q07_1768 [Acidobacteria bacterium]|nr:hypothetical protein [Acidobacteriota bacterium]
MNPDDLSRSNLIVLIWPHTLQIGMDTDQVMQQINPSGGRKWPKRVCCGCLTVIVAILGLSAASNLFFPTRSNPVDRLSDLEKARLTEAFRLRRTVGDSIWAGWSNAPIPIIVYNEAYAFLIGLDNPEPGWRTVPQNFARGGPWELISGDTVDGRKHYRQRLVNERVSPQAFTVRIGECWAASMTMKDWIPIKMGNDIKHGMPSAVRALVPYRLIAAIFLGLAMNTDGYICAIEHESFHAYQGMVYPDRLASAEIVLSKFGRKYPWTDSGFNEQWKAEANALADALSATQEKRTVELADRFMALRRARRKAFHLDAALLNLERLREWEEGLGKYTELAIWKRAASDVAYKPVQALSRDSNFDDYRSFDKKWVQEMTTLRRQSSGDDNRFYYTGMAQAFLLDRLNPGWRMKIAQSAAASTRRPFFRPQKEWRECDVHQNNPH